MTWRQKFYTLSKIDVQQAMSNGAALRTAVFQLYAKNARGWLYTTDVEINYLYVYLYVRVIYPPLTGAKAKSKIQIHPDQRATSSLLMLCIHLPPLKGSFHTYFIAFKPFDNI